MPWTPSAARAAALALLCALSGACSVEGTSSASAGDPRLVVLVSVDQLMPEQLERYDAAWQGGFRRLLDRGLVFEDAVHAHAITYTSPGHASLVTGAIPARHGVVGNSWREWDGEGWVGVSSVVDPNTAQVGAPGQGSSPHRLLRDGLPDWLLERHPDSRVVSVSGKRTAAVLLAARAPGHVYWFDQGAGAFVTSDHYRPRLPDWVEAFDRDVVSGAVTGVGCWEQAVPEAPVGLSRRDTVSWESDGASTHFPHCPDDPRFDGEGHFVSRSPVLDHLTLELAREAVRALDLGRREAPDYLAVGLSATDRIGHDFGPWSREQLDNLMRVDRELGAFLEFLDRTVGPDGYLLALSSDHGVLPLPEHLQEEGRPGRRLTGELRGELERAARRAGAPVPVEDWIRDDDSYGTDAGADLRRELARALEEVEWVEDVMPLELLASDAPADSFVTLYRNSFHPERLTTNLARFGVEARLAEGTLVRAAGTSHGAPYLHDRRVPLILRGPGLTAGRVSTPVRTVDLAPTLAGMLAVPAPEDLDGRPLPPSPD